MTILLVGTMYRGKSSGWKIHEFDREEYDKTLSWECVIRIDEIEFNNSKKLDGKIAAGLIVLVNRSGQHCISDLGSFKAKSGPFVWNQKTAVDERMLPVSLHVNVAERCQC